MPGHPKLTNGLRSLARGPLPPLPEVLDGAAERWFAAAPRARLVIGLLAVALFVFVTGKVAGGSPWREETAVLVAARELPAGHTLAPGDLVPTSRPVRSLPDGTVDVGIRWVGAATAGPLPAGAVVAAAHLAEGGLTDLVGPGRVAVAVPAELLPPLDAGRDVDLVGGDGQRGGEPLARDARVLATDGGHVWIEVARADAGAVAAAVAWGRITVALLGP